MKGDYWYRQFLEVAGEPLGTWEPGRVRWWHRLLHRTPKPVFVPIETVQVMLIDEPDSGRTTP